MEHYFGWLEVDGKILLDEWRWLGMIGSELGKWCGVGALFDNGLGKLLDENRKFHI